jgi:hypothetical protein
VAPVTTPLSLMAGALTTPLLDGSISVTVLHGAAHTNAFDELEPAGKYPSPTIIPELLIAQTSKLDAHPSQA